MLDETGLIMSYLSGSISTVSAQDSRVIIGDFKPRVRRNQAGAGLGIADTPRSKRFQNIHPHAPHSLSGVLRWKLGLARPAGQARTLSHPPPAVSGLLASAASLSFPPANGQIRLTWIGHSTFLLQHHGCNILTDPIFGNCQPLPFGRLRRQSPPE